MIHIIVYITFILSVAFAAGGVILSSRLRNRLKSDMFSSLVYFQVFIFTFGFYGLWGQVVIKVFLAEYVSAELLIRFINIAILMGLPFLVFAWLMLIKFSREISGRENNNWLVFWYLLLNFLIIFAIGYIISKTSTLKPLLLVKYYYIGLNFLYSILASFYILFPAKRNNTIHTYDRRIISLVVILIMIAQCLTLLIYNDKPYIALAFIFTFFAGNSFLPVYMSYGMIFSVLNTDSQKDISYDEFCRKYEVSPRESDIIREICKGLSNKEISDKLFISIQTVKDHTHRIYIKTNVRSRVQLMTLVREVRGM
jgi:DNA-binding CsgD family transcriptional regulator